ncbi:hypothetical protein [Roseateles sp.]|uniref:hypothetical protein n=1 Tax=Roseateles sp. TaxID=1971397 RepID=UPI002F414A13
MKHPFTVAVQVGGEWHEIAQCRARLWAGDIALALVQSGSYATAQVWEDGAVVATYGEQS